LITLLSAFGFCLWLGFLWVKFHGSFTVLALKYLCVAPFLPLIGIFNHNIDHDQFEAPVMLFPVFLLLGLMCLSLLEWSRALKHMRLSSSEMFLGLYALLTLLQIPLSVDPVWSLNTWTWSVSGYFLFLIAGRFTSVDALSSTRAPLFAVLGFIGVNLGLIALGLYTGRADNLFLTRNFGSFYASTAMLLFLSLFAGIAWLGLAHSRVWRVVFIQVSLVAMVFSLSRTAMLVLPLYASFLIDRRRRRPQGRLTVALLIVIALVAIYVVVNRSGVGTELAATWDQRFSGWRVWESFLDAQAVRSDEFAEFRRRAFSETLLFGWGFGTFRFFSNYADAHNFFITEALENGAVAAFVLLLSFSIPRAVAALREKSLRPIAASILTFLVIAFLSGGMLSNRAPGQYYSALPGWALFFLIGCLNPAIGKAQAVTASTASTE
jgi:hypothetical protein